MDTATKTHSDHRELTKTEIEIATAQIIDRLTRSISAARRFYGLLDKRKPSDETNEEEWKSVKGKTLREVQSEFDIPEGVFLFNEEGMRLSSVPVYKPFIKHWVAGTLTSEECDHMLFWLGELDEVDYGWIFLEKPCWFYSDAPESAPPLDSINEEFMKLGTRTKRKHLGKKFHKIMPY